MPSEPLVTIRELAERRAAVWRLLSVDRATIRRKYPAAFDEPGRAERGGWQDRR